MNLTISVDENRLTCGQWSAHLTESDGLDIDDFVFFTWRNGVW